MKVILEEARYGAESIARDLAQSRRIYYKNIDMTEAERQKAGLRTIYSLPPEHYAAMGEQPPDIEREYAPDLEKREAHFLEKIRANLPPSGDVLLILGEANWRRMKPTLQQLADCEFLKFGI